MRPVHRFATPAVLLLLALGPTAGCGPVDSSQISPSLIPEHVNVLRLRISAFDSSRPQGLWLWRMSETSGEYEPVSEIRFGETVVEEDREYVSYRLLDPTGQDLGVELSAEVERDGGAATLALWLVRFTDPGQFKATIYNEAGESGLSAETVVL